MEKKDDKQLSPDSFQKVICHDAKLQPYINAFHFKGEHFDQQKIGEIFGVIQILDHSENSAYIPNLLAQVIKKEFYSNYKRITSKSFEAALHKANLALSDLAQHEITEWIGKINAVIGVIKNEEFHFTQAGGGKILLLRDKKLTDIGKGLDTGEGIGHPIKTFSNISSGDLELKDKLIFSSDSAFESIRLDELKRHAKTFKSTEFDNIVNSTLDLEAQNAALLLINITEKSLSIKSENKKNEKKLKIEKDANYFGTPSEEDDSKKEDKKIKEDKSTKPEKNKKDEIEEKDASIVMDSNKKNLKKPEELSKAQALAAAEAKIEEEKKIKKDSSAHEEEKIDQRAIAEYYSPDNEDSSPFEEEPELFIKAEDIEKEEAELEQKLERSRKSFIELTKNFLEENFKKIKKTLNSYYKEKVMNSREKKENVVINNSLSTEFKDSDKEKIKISAPTERKGLPIPSIGEKVIYYSKNFLEIIIKKVKKLYKKIIKKIKNIDLKSISNPSQFKNTFSSLIKNIKNIELKNIKKNKWAIGLLILIIILAFILLKPKKQKEAPIENNSITEQPSLLENPALEKEIEITDLKSISQIEEKVTSLTSLNNNIYFSTEENSFLKLDHQSNRLDKIVLPDYIEKIKTITAIPSLQLIFLVNSTSVYSYSPVTEIFYDNQISLPDNLEGQSSDVYLTYIYLLDKNQGQIFQYPRATGGFGEMREWIRDGSNISNAIDMTIDNAIYLTFEDGHVEKFFQGKKQNDFNLQETDPTIFADKIRGNIESENLFILDSKNQRVIEINKQGNIINQFQDRKFLGAQNFWVDFEQKIIYIIGSKGEIFSFNYN